MNRRHLILLAAVVLLLFVPLVAIAPLRDATARLLHPIGVFLTERNQTIRNAWLNLRSIGAVHEERNQLQEQVIALQQKVIADDSLKQENNDLRQELGVTGVTRDTSKVFTHVVLQGDDPLDYAFTIDVGRAQGIQVGQPAVAQGVLIGRVSEVRERTAVVRAVTSLNSRVQAWLVPSQEKGFLVGTGNAVELQEITQGLDIPVGTVVATSGLGGSLPQGILIGSTDAVLSAKSSLTQTFRVTLPVSPQGIHSLFILLTDQP